MLKTNIKERRNNYFKLLCLISVLIIPRQSIRLPQSILIQRLSFMFDVILKFLFYEDGYSEENNK